MLSFNKEKGELENLFWVDFADSENKGYQSQFDIIIKAVVGP